MDAEVVEDVAADEKMSLIVCRFALIVSRSCTAKSVAETGPRERRDEKVVPWSRSRADTPSFSLPCTRSASAAATSERRLSRSSLAWRTSLSSTDDRDI